MPTDKVRVTMPTENVKVTISTDTDHHNGYVAQDLTNKARDVAQSTVATVQDVSSKAKDVAQSTASTLQNTVQSGLTRTQKMLLAGLGLVQALLSRNFRRRNLKKQASRNLKQAQKNLGRVQNTVQDTMQSGLSAAQDVLGKNVKSASKNLKRAQKQAQMNVRKAQKQAQKNLGRVQDTVQDNLLTGLGAAQEVLSKRTKSASKSVKRVTKNVKGMQESWQGRIEGYQRRRARARFLFRVGLVAGVVLALMYAPWPGSQTRQQLAGFWQQLSQRTKELINSFSA